MADHSHSIADHGHAHAFLGADHESKERRTIAAVALTLVMMAGEIVAGWMFGSMALLADGVHMATHAGALGIAAAAYFYARTRQGDPRFTFGTGKVGEVAGFASALILGIVALWIAWESAMRLIEPHPVAFREATVVAAIGLGVNIATAALLAAGGHGHDHGHGHGHGHDHGHGHGHGHGHAHDHGHAQNTGPSHKHEDANFRSAYLHIVADALTSVLAIAALLAGRFLGWVWADAAVGILGAIVIALWSRSLLASTFRVLVDATDPRLVERVRRAVEAGGDATVSDIHVWQVGPGAQAAIIHLVAAQPRAVDEYHARLKGFDTLRHISVEVRQCEECG